MMKLVYCPNCEQFFKVVPQNTVYCPYCHTPKEIRQQHPVKLINKIYQEDR